MEGFRQIEPLPSKGVCNEPGPAPEILYLEPRQLVVNEEYQRGVSRAGIRQIRQMAERWDWSAFKAPSVARTDDPDLYEVVDGQHTAIAAATNGTIPYLPCLVMSAETLAEKASGFLGINRDRIALTKAAIYNALVAAQDETAITVFCALSDSGCRMLDVPPNAGRWEVGDTLAVGTLLDIGKRRGGPRLTTLLTLLKGAQAAPISSMALKALDLALPLDPPDDVLNRAGVILRSQGVSRLETIAKSRTSHGARAYETMADTLADLMKLGGRRLGRTAPARQAEAA